LSINITLNRQSIKESLFGGFGKSIWEWYLAGKATLGYRQIFHAAIYSTDIFTDIAITSWISGRCCLDNDARAEFASSPGGNDGQRYSQYLNASRSTDDHLIEKSTPGASTTIIASEAVDLEEEQYYHLRFEVVGSSLSAYRDDMSTPRITATDTDLASGRVGSVAGGHPASGGQYGAFPGIIEAVSSSGPQAIVIAELPVENAQIVLPRNVVADERLNMLNIPVRVKRAAKIYRKLKEKGFTDEEIEMMRIPVKKGIDTLSVTWGAFDFKPSRSSMAIIAIYSGNPYNSKAVESIAEYVKSRGGRVYKIKDWKQAIEVYSELKKDHSYFEAGKDNFVYHATGIEVFKLAQVADFYYGNLVEHKRHYNEIKRANDNYIRALITRYKSALQKYNTDVAKKHVAKLDEIERKGW